MTIYRPLFKFILRHSKPSLTFDLNNPADEINTALNKWI